MTKVKNNRGKKHTLIKKRAYSVFNKWLENFQLLYNLSPNLSKSQVTKLQAKFIQIIQSQTMTNTKIDIYN